MIFTRNKNACSHISVSPTETLACPTECTLSKGMWRILEFYVIFGGGRDSPKWARTSSFTRFLDHTRLTIFGRTSLYEWSARRRDLYLTTLTTHINPSPTGIRTHNLSRRAAVDLRLLMWNILRGNVWKKFFEGLLELW